MTIKLIVSIAGPEKTDHLLDLARKAGATGATVLANGRGEGMFKQKGIMGLELRSQRDVLLFLVPERICDDVMKQLVEAGGFDTKAGTGVAFTLDVGEVHGLRHELENL